MAALSLAAFDAALKEIYTNDEIERLTLNDHPFLAMLLKDENFYGDSLPIPVIYGSPQGRSADFTQALANQTSTLAKKFVLTRVADYCVSAIEGEVMDASENDAGAFLEARVAEFDGAFQSIAQSLSTALFRNGTGSIGRIGANVGATTIDGTNPTIDWGLSEPVMRLATVADIVNFEVGMSLSFSATDGGAIRTTGGGIEVIAGVDRYWGTLEATSTDWDTVITSLVAGDYISVNGDLNAKVKGLDAWLPSVADIIATPTLFTLDRSVDPERLGGVRYDGSSDPIEEAFTQAASLLARYGASPSHLFCSFARYADLENSLGARVHYDHTMVTERIGFRTIVLNGPRGEIRVVPDACCQNDVGWLLSMPNWKFYSLKKAPRILNRDGTANGTLRSSTIDGEEFRIGYYGQLGCRAPGWSCRITLPT